ncbi:hypothetical protein HHK36_004345 [Tetracentron sinense]|uniref:Peptidase A1 domain-containing protein n=1 Tax=Tetracentron sinense TaxID=13715 RepID=A0A834ZZT1_TETSI|nr:hypothetical protein HHK36_004345 [Tetracentron sinense]
MAKTEADGEVQTPIHAGSGEFLMKFSINTPLQPFKAILDTGSDLILIQCKPCTTVPINPHPFSIQSIQLPSLTFHALLSYAKLSAFRRVSMVAASILVITPTTPQHKASWQWRNSHSRILLANSLYPPSGSAAWRITMEMGSPKMKDKLDLGMDVGRVFADQMGLPVLNSGYAGFELCFMLSSANSQIIVPNLVFNFKGADLKLPPKNYMIRFDSDGMVCLAMKRSRSGMSIFGNMQ